MKTTGNLLLESTFILISLLFMTTGCKKENEPAPAIPPQSSFVMDFSDFSNPGDTIGAREIATYQNWGYSYTSVVVWQTILTVGLAVPVASFVESFNHEAVYHPDHDNWTWSYNVTVNLVVYEAELTAYLEADSVVWEMRITKDGEYTDFRWYYGKTAAGGNGGYWILQENPLNIHNFLKIEWGWELYVSTYLRYINIKPYNPYNGSYIYYTYYPNYYFDRNYNIFNKGLNYWTSIEWHSVDKDGHVMDSHHFGDEQWHCWDTSLMDVVCP